MVEAIMLLTIARFAASLNNVWNKYLYGLIFLKLRHNGEVHFWCRTWGCFSCTVIATNLTSTTYNYAFYIFNFSSQYVASPFWIWTIFKLLFQFKRTIKSHKFSLKNFSKNLKILDLKNRIALWVVYGNKGGEMAESQLKNERQFMLAPQ